MPFDFGDMYWPILINSVCHLFVYLHYLCSCLGLHSFWYSHLATIQVVQFAAIFLQSVLAFWEGPQCGSPDFAKLLMMVYMGSMLVLFSDFFIKRYILKQPAYDMCGVIKSVEFTGGPSTAQYFGSCRLGPDGSGEVRLPRHFREGLAHPTYVYGLTPVGHAMPNLCVGQPVERRRSGGGESGGLINQPLSASMPYYSFVIRGGRPNGLVSWTVCCVTGDESIRLH